jgi:hypothetical protein
MVPRAHGPTIARWLLALGFLVMLFEIWLAWRLGPSRSAMSGLSVADQAGQPPRFAWPLRALGLIPAVVVAALLGSCCTTN